MRWIQSSLPVIFMNSSKGNPEYITLFSGSYMPEYFWAEDMIALSEKPVPEI